MCNPASNYWPGKEKRPGADVEVMGRDGSRFTARVCRPDGAPPYPTVLILHDYQAVCPDLFHRHGKLLEQTHPAASERIGAVTDQEVFDDVDATLDYLRSEDLVGDLAVTGFCWGGRMAYLVVAQHPEVKLLLPFYGHLSAWSPPDGPKPGSPLDEAEKIKARVVGAYGGGDEGIPLDQVEEMERRLRASGLQAELKIYPGAPHCFFRTPDYAPYSDDAWGRVLAALGETLKQGARMGG